MSEKLGKERENGKGLFVGVRKQPCGAVVSITYIREPRKIPQEEICCCSCLENPFVCNVSSLPNFRYRQRAVRTPIADGFGVGIELEAASVNCWVEAVIQCRIKAGSKPTYHCNWS